MTREEAIWYLTPIAESASLERYKEALSMAVSSLREQEERRWIPVTERLPENIANRVLVVCERSNGVFYAHYEKPFWINLETDKPFISTVTHWIPLPEPPKEEKDK